VQRNDRVREEVQERLSKNSRLLANKTKLYVGTLPHYRARNKQHPTGGGSVVHKGGEGHDAITHRALRTGRVRKKHSC